MTGKEKPPAPDKPEGERIAKVLSRAGIASRRKAERLIELGEVKVNGKVITSPALNVTPKDKITVRGEPVGQPEPARLWLYYKPEGLVTSAADERGRDMVFDHLPEDLPRVMSVGRLDLNSEGLLLLTNDGGLKRRLELPSTGWLRKYRVRVKGNPTDPELEPLRKGVTVDGEKFQPMEVRLDRHQGANAWLTVGIREGRNREIRRAMAHIGLTVNRLIRTSYGPFRLNELKPGEVEEIKPRVLRDQLGLQADAQPEKPAKPSPRGRSATGDAKPSPRGRFSTDDENAAKTRSGPAKPSDRPLKPGEGLKRLSEAWQKATRPPTRKTADRPAAGRPTRSGGPKKG
jgi:23S rRNA pseudouridine2605 synthase